MKKNFSILFLSLVLVLSFSTTAFAQTKVSTPALSGANNAKTKLMSSYTSLTPIHKAALPPSPLSNKAGTIKPMDVQPTWTYSMSSQSNLYFQIITGGAVATVLAGQFGGAVATWSGFANTLISGWLTTEHDNVFYTAYYYYQYTASDPVFPYYVKQFLICYSDSARTHYIGSNTRYYYSSLPW